MADHDEGKPINTMSGRGYTVPIPSRNGLCPRVEHRLNEDRGANFDVLAAGEQP